MARHKILNAFAVPAAGAFTSDPVTIGEAGDLTAVFDFDWGSGGTSIRLWLQTSFDGGTTWYDIISPSQFATADAVEIYSVSASGDLSTAPTEGSKALAAASIQSGMIGDMIRVAGTVVGTYAASTITVIVEARQDAGGSGALDTASLTALEAVTNQYNLTSVTVAIADAASLSAEGDLGANASLVGIITPAGWTTAVLSFQAALASGGTFVDYHNSAGAEVVTGSFVASKWYALDPADFAGIRYIKVRSGTSAAAVAQAGGDTLTLVVRTV